MSETLQLYSYWRSSAAYRVRIGLNLKGLAYDLVPVHLVRGGGDLTLVTYGATLSAALECAEILEKSGVSAEVVKISRLAPLDAAPILDSVARTGRVLIAEEVCAAGGMGEQVLSLLVAENHQESVLVATENGFGKRTVLADFRHSGRGTQGVIAIAASERNGKVVAARLVKDEDEIMLITTGGVLIRTRVSEIRELGRATQGVTLIALDEGEKLASLEKIVETEEENGENGENGEA